MQSQDLEEIKAALWEQASHPCTRVGWGASPGDGSAKKPRATAGPTSRALALVSGSSCDD